MLAPGDDVVDAADVAFNAVAWTVRPPPRPARLAGEAGKTPRRRRPRRPRRAYTRRKEPDREHHHDLAVPRAAVPCEPGDRVVPEPPRRGEPGGPPVRHLRRQDDTAVWSDETWTLHPRSGAACRAPSGWRAASTSTRSATCPARRRRLRPRRRAGRAGDARARRLGRVHLYRWGDGGAHFHVWFVPRPLGHARGGRDDAAVWEDVLPNVTDEELAGGGAADRAPRCDDAHGRSRAGSAPATPSSSGSAR